MPKVTGKSEEGVQAVVLALQIIERVVEEGRPVGVTALAQALGTTKSRIHRHLQTLVGRGYLAQQTETERYQVGPRLVGLARMVGDNLDLVDIATPVLRDLRDALGHYSVLSLVEEDGIRVQTAINGRSLVEIGVRRGSLLPFHASAQGKVALAYGDEILRRRILRSRLDMLTPHTIVSPAALEQELELIRRQGWAGGPNESLLGLNALAAPVFDATGTLVATVGIVDSIQFLPDPPSDDQVRETTRAAAAVSALLGHRGRPALPRPAAEAAGA